MDIFLGLSKKKYAERVSVQFSSTYEREIKTWGVVLYSLVDFTGVAKER
jgi:hypothetical protein